MREPGGSEESRGGGGKGRKEVLEGAEKKKKTSSTENCNLHPAKRLQRERLHFASLRGLSASLFARERIILFEVLRALENCTGWRGEWRERAERAERRCRALNGRKCLSLSSHSPPQLLRFLPCAEANETAHAAATSASTNNFLRAMALERGEERND